MTLASISAKSAIIYQQWIEETEVKQTSESENRVSRTILGDVNNNQVNSLQEQAHQRKTWREGDRKKTKRSFRSRYKPKRIEIETQRPFSRFNWRDETDAIRNLIRLCFGSISAESAITPAIDLMKQLTGSNGTRKLVIIPVLGGSKFSKAEQRRTIECAALQQFQWRRSSECEETREEVRETKVMVWNPTWMMRVTRCWCGIRRGWIEFS